MIVLFPKIWFGELSFSTYYTMMLLGFVFMLVLMLRRKKQYSLNTGQAILFTVCVMFSGVLGCKLLYILEHLGEPFEWGGFSFFGAVFLVPVLMILFGKLFRLSPGKSTDAAAICVCAMIGTIRIGCFGNGCCGGRTTAGGFTWPTQIMESIGDFVILYYLIRMEKEGKKGLYPRFMVAYGVLRFIIEFFRATSEGKVLDEAHFLALISIAIGLSIVLSLLGLKKNSTKHNKKRERK